MDPWGSGTLHNPKSDHGYAWSIYFQASTIVHCLDGLRRNHGRDRGPLKDTYKII